MSERSEEETMKSELRSLRLRPILLAIVANVLFAGVFLGIPYTRGQARAEESARSFARFAACLFDARASENPGLSLPRGERARFASLALGDDPEWPRQCERSLASVAPAPADFLIPSVKAAEHEVREAVRALRRELANVARRRAEGRVPRRALDALGRLQSAMALLISASGIEVDPLREVIVLSNREHDLLTPTIAPLRIASGGRWEVGLDDAVLVTAIDGRVIAHVRVTDGRVGLHTTRHPALASSFLGAHEPPWVIWTTPESSCGADCARRATGIAAFTEDRQRLAPLAWLQGHSAADPSAALTVRGSTAWIAARSETGGLEARSFTVPEASETPGHVAPILARVLEESAIDAPAVHWSADDPPVLVWASPAGACFWVAGAEGSGIVLEGPMGASPKFLASACGWIAVADDDAVRIRRSDGQGIQSSLTPGGSAVRMLCDRDAAIAIWLTADGDVRRARCDLNDCESDAIATGAASFDAVRFRGADLVAWTDDAERGAVHLTRIASNGARTSYPAACWEPMEGLCGEPRIVANVRDDRPRAVIVTRQGSDLRIVESADGVRWTAIPGLEQP